MPASHSSAENNGCPSTLYACWRSFPYDTALYGFVKPIIHQFSYKKMSEHMCRFWAVLRYGWDESRRQTGGDISDIKALLPDLFMNLSKESASFTSPIKYPQAYDYGLVDMAFHYGDLVNTDAVNTIRWRRGIIPFEITDVNVFIVSHDTYYRLETSFKAIDLNKSVT